MLRMLPPAMRNCVGHEVQVHVFGTWRSLRERALPDAEAVLYLRERELDNGAHTSQEGFVQIGAQVGRQHDDAVELLHPLQQIADLDVGVTIVGVLDLAAFAEHRIGLVEEEDDVGIACLFEDAGKVLLRLADVFRDQPGEVDLINVQPEVVGDDLRSHGLTGAGLAGKEGSNTPAQR